MPCSCAMPHMAAGSTDPPRWTWSSVSSSPSGCGTLASLFARGRPAHPPSATRCRGPALGMLAPDRVAVVVGRGNADEPIPYFGATELFLRGLSSHIALQHDIAVIRRADDTPAILGEQVEEPRDLREPLRLLGDVLAQPGRVRPLPAILAIELVPDRPEDMDEDVGRSGHEASLGLAPFLHEAVAAIGILRDHDERPALETRLAFEGWADQVVMLVLGRHALAALRFDLGVEPAGTDAEGNSLAGIGEELPCVLGDQDPGFPNVLRAEAMAVGGTGNTHVVSIFARNAATRGTAGQAPGRRGWALGERRRVVQETHQMHDRDAGAGPAQACGDLQHAAGVRADHDVRVDVDDRRDLLTLQLRRHVRMGQVVDPGAATTAFRVRSEEHTSELQSRGHLVC